MSYFRETAYISLLLVFQLRCLIHAKQNVNENEKPRRIQSRNDSRNQLLNILEGQPHNYFLASYNHCKQYKQLWNTWEYKSKILKIEQLFLRLKKHY